MGKDIKYVEIPVNEYADLIRTDDRVQTVISIARKQGSVNLEQLAEILDFEISEKERLPWK